MPASDQITRFDVARDGRLVAVTQRDHYAGAGWTGLDRHPSSPPTTVPIASPAAEAPNSGDRARTYALS